MKKINPKAVTDYNRTDAELQKFWLFCIIVAGKNADWASEKVEMLLADMPDFMKPFGYLRSINVLDKLQEIKTGQYNRISRAINESVGLDLRTAAPAQLEAVHGVSHKTSRFFVIHTRKHIEDVAALDTHLLGYLDWLGFADIPKGSVSNSKRYTRLEWIFVQVKRLLFPDDTMAEADLKIWMTMSGRSYEPLPTITQDEMDSILGGLEA